MELLSQKGTLVLLNVVLVDEAFDVAEQPLGNQQGILVVHHQYHIHFRIVLAFHQEAADFLYGHLERQFLGKAIVAGGQEGDGHSAAAKHPGQPEGVPVAATEDVHLALPAVLVGDSHRMDDVLHPVPAEVVGRRVACLSPRYFADGFPSLQQLFRSRRRVDGRVRAAPNGGLWVGRVYNGVRVYQCDVVPFNPERHFFLQTTVYHGGEIFPRAGRGRERWNGWRGMIM